MKRSEEFAERILVRGPRTLAEAAKLRLLRASKVFARDEDGSLIIFGLMMFCLMLMVGGLSFDIMRYETHRERLQSTVDRAVLAAASLNQTMDPQTVVEQYFAAAGMTDYLDSVVVVQGISSRRVTAKASINVPLHHGDFKINNIGGGGTPGETGDYVDTLRAYAEATAEESIGNVEISMVLDVSGSMGSQSRLTNLKSAARDFLDTVYDAAEPGAVSTSIIPFSEQVSAGPTLLSYLQRADSHETSHCLNFKASDFETTTLSLTEDYEQTLTFDPWTDERNTYGYAIGEDLPNPTCPTDTSQSIMTWSTNKAALKTFVQGLDDDGNTSTDIGLKWGAALLDPSAQTIVTDMIANGDLSNDMEGRPFIYNSSEAMKILVVMTDGDNTSQHYMDDYRSGNSFVWKYVTGDNVYYSIWSEGEDSTPVTNPPPFESEYICTRYRRKGSCRDGYWTEAEDKWFVAYNTNFDGNGSTQYMWREKPYGEGDAQRMTWAEVWQDIPPEYFSDEVLWEMDTLSDNDRNAFEYAVESHGTSTKDDRMRDICTAIKNQNVIVFAVGLAVSSSSRTLLTNCASSDSHYYDVSTLDIDEAFQSIASQINQLRLTQ